MAYWEPSLHHLGVGVGIVWGVIFVVCVYMAIRG